MGAGCWVLVLSFTSTQNPTPSTRLSFIIHHSAFIISEAWAYVRTHRPAQNLLRRLRRADLLHGADGHRRQLRPRQDERHRGDDHPSNKECAWTAFLHAVALHFASHLVHRRLDFLLAPHPAPHHAPRLPQPQLV